MKDLWVDRFRPETIDDYIFTSVDNKSKVSEWIAQKSIPHLLLSGPAGTGKTSLALILMKMLDVDDADFLRINASAKNGVDYVRDTIINFSTMMPVGDFKYILLDESDHLSTQAQAALRGVIDENSDTTRFILTANYPHKIIEPIHSRCQSIRVEKLDKDQFIVKIAQILIEVGVDVDPDTLMTHVDATYPDMRKCINNCQRYTIGNKLNLPQSDEVESSEVMLVSTELFKQGKFKEAREYVCKKISYEEYDDFYRFMYDNLELWGNCDEKKSKCIRAIRDGLVKDTSIADREINLSATLVTLEMINQGYL